MEGATGHALKAQSPRPSESYTLETHSSASKSSESYELQDRTPVIDENKTAEDSVERVRTVSDGDQSQKVGVCEDPMANLNGAVEYKTMEWYHAAALMIAETMSLGILSLPGVVAAVGFIPGVLLIAIIGLLASYTGYVIYQFKLRYPGMHDYADVGEMLCGKAGRWVAEVAQTLIFIFIMAAHILTFSVMMNVLTEHGTCTIVFSVVGMGISIVLSVPRTMKGNHMISVFSCASIVTAVIIAMIGIGITKPGLGNTYAITPSNITTFHAGALATSEIIIAFTGHVAYFGFISEMQNPKDFPKALALLQTVAITFYLVVAVVIYYFAGQHVASPALGSASPVVRKIAFGIAAPTIIVAGVINAHVCAKNVYVKVWRNQPKVMAEVSRRAWASWLIIITVLWIVAWLIGSVIPVFSQLLGLIGALFCTWFSLGFSAVMWLWMNWQMNNKVIDEEGKQLEGESGKKVLRPMRETFRLSYLVNWRKASLATLNVVIFCISATICGLGLYGSAEAMAQNSTTRKPFSCADNSV